MRVRLRAEGCVDHEWSERTDRDQPEVEAGALEDVPDAEDRTAGEPENHGAAASSAALTSASASSVELAPHVLEVDLVVGPQQLLDARVERREVCLAHSILAGDLSDHQQ